MDKLNFAKKAARFVVALSTGHCITSIINNNLAPASPIQKVEVTVGSYVAGSMVADRAGDWSDAQFDKAASWWNENVKKS